MSDIKRIQLTSVESREECDKPPKRLAKTVRISVVLPESNEDCCPDYDYKNELAAAKKRVRASKDGKKDAIHATNGLDPFGDDDDDDVRRIAMQMEQKYGTDVGKKKRKGRRDDYADIGMGYDESDSFIDNTDGYDEIIPHNVTTLHGGFYINCGALEFKTDNEATSDFSSSDSESDVENNKSVVRKRPLDTTDEEDEEDKDGHKADKPDKPHKKNKIDVKKRKLADPLKKTVKDLLKEKRQDLNMSVPNDTIVEIIVDDEHVQRKSDGESSHVVKKDTVEIIALPENLPADISDAIKGIKQAALDAKDGKKMFDDSMNQKLLSLERKCRCLGKSSRGKVYDHLAPFLKIKKESLIRRAKNLIFADEENKLKKMLIKLKSAVDEIMPALLSNHEKESQKVLLKKFSHEGTSSEEAKSMRMPQRKFQWTDDLKKLFRDIIATKRRCFLLEGKIKNTLDDLILQYLKSDLQVLWPEGWMSIAHLKRVCNIEVPGKVELPKPIKVQDVVKINTSIEPPKHSQIALKNSHLQIIPVSSSSTKTNSSSNHKHDVISDLTVSKISNTVTSQKLPDKSLTITPTPSEPAIKVDKDDHKFFDFSKSIQLPETSIQSVDSTVIVPAPKAAPPADIKKDSNAVIIEPKHCQIVDLTEPPRKKPGPKSKTIKEPLSLSVSDFLSKPAPKPMMDPQSLPMDFSKDPLKLKSKHPEVTIVPNFHNPMESTSEVDDIQKVMENLKTLQKLSSPSKTAENSISSPVSVIAFNKNFSPKTSAANHNRNDYKPSDFSTNFQDEFQKQLMNSLTQMSTPTSSKSNYNRCS